jgi:hypothetical protein
MTGPDKGKGGKYLILPPGYTGEVPEGYLDGIQTPSPLWFFRKEKTSTEAPLPQIVGVRSSSQPTRAHDEKSFQGIDC